MFHTTWPDAALPEKSARFEEYGKVVKAAEAELLAAKDKDFVKKGVMDHVSRMNSLYKHFCLQPATEVSRLLSSRGQDNLIIAFDECNSLERNDMSVQAVWRIVKAEDTFSTSIAKGFGFWFTYLDTNSRVSLLVPRKGPFVPSGRLASTLMPLPPFVRLGMDQMRKGNSVSPSEALKLDNIKLLGRPVSSATIAIDVC